MAAGKGRTTRRASADTLITDARHGRSKDLRGREVRYLVTMGFRIACFVALIFVPSNSLRLGLVVAAAVLPAFAVLIANAVDQRTATARPVEQGEPEERRALPRESTDIVSSNVVDEP